jgi:hypothetical protein
MSFVQFQSSKAEPAEKRKVSDSENHSLSASAEMGRQGLIFKEPLWNMAYRGM